jgi:hypothetical protein
MKTEKEKTIARLRAKAIAARQAKAEMVDVEDVIKEAKARKQAKRCMAMRSLKLERKLVKPPTQ